MTSKLHNRTLFVAALSVYLGLLVVGAPPQVLARQSKSIIAINGKTAVAECDEIALREEARKKFAELDLIAQDVPDLTNITRVLFRDDYRFLWGDFERFNVSVSLSESKTKPYQQPSFKIEVTNGTSESNLPGMEDFLRHIGMMADFFGRSGCPKTQIKCSPFELLLSLNETEFTSSVKLPRKSSQEAQHFAQAYKSLINANACHFSNYKTLQFHYENTNVSARNNQVFIVTRLPRAALDSLNSRANEKVN